MSTDARTFDGTRAALKELDKRSEELDNIISHFREKGSVTKEDGKAVERALDAHTEAAHTVGIKFAEDTADINPTLLRDVKSGLISTCPRGKLVRFARRIACNQ